MFDFDPCDCDDDVRDIEMTWIKLGHASDRIANKTMFVTATRVNEASIRATRSSTGSSCGADSNGSS
jgi:hypothetical protein